MIEHVFPMGYVPSIESNGVTIPALSAFNDIKKKIDEIVDEVNQLRPLCRALEVAISETNRRITYIDGIGGSVEKLQKRITELGENTVATINKLFEQPKQEQQPERCAHDNVCNAFKDISFNGRYAVSFKRCENWSICVNRLPISKVMK